MNSHLTVQDKVPVDSKWLFYLQLLKYYWQAYSYQASIKEVLLFKMCRRKQKR